MENKIKTYSDVCEHLGIGINDGIPYLNPKTSMELYLNSNVRIVNIVRCFNGNWYPNWSDSSECKYYPYFDMISTGFIFTYSVHVSTGTYVGSRLCFKNKEDCEYAAKQFIDIYYDFFVWNVRLDNINDILK